MVRTSHTPRTGRGVPVRRRAGHRRGPARRLLPAALRRRGRRGHGKAWSRPAAAVHRARRRRRGRGALPDRVCRAQRSGGCADGGTALLARLARSPRRPRCRTGDRHAARRRRHFPAGAHPRSVRTPDAQRVVRHRRRDRGCGERRKGAAAPDRGGRHDEPARAGIRRPDGHAARGRRRNQSLHHAGIPPFAWSTRSSPTSTCRAPRC